MKGRVGISSSHRCSTQASSLDRTAGHPFSGFARFVAAVLGDGLLAEVAPGDRPIGPCEDLLGGWSKRGVV